MKKNGAPSLKRKPAFTLIELLVVITIINILSSVILVSATGARRDQRMVRRVSDLLELRKALELYNLRNNGNYPSTCPGGVAATCSPIQAVWWSECGGAFLGNPAQGQPNGWIPELVSQGYMRALPRDPFIDTVAVNSPSCLGYKSTGIDYKVMLKEFIDVPPTDQSDYIKQPQFFDPRRDGGPNDCVLDSPTNPTTAYAAWTIYSEGTLKVPADCARW